ncbi:MAG: serine/threonine protein kinase [Deltaproteobacteria bacterium]|nr:serine/threonine protein kinase [Deltaproteobacteria bacterium]
MPIVVADRFELLAQAARGGMASVWRARDLLSGAQVAVKTIAACGPSELARFEREAALLATLDHANVVAYIAHGANADGSRYLVEEWVEGASLSAYLAHTGATASEAVRIAIGVGDALGAVHRLGVLHRDVKPGNVILTGTTVKLVDFGIARSVVDAGQLTGTGVLIGTPSYMSPEQSRGTTMIEPACDVWALGCVLYEALSGRKAFHGRTHEAVRAKVLLANPEPLSTLCAEAPDALVALVHAMLSKSPAERPADGAAASAALRAVLADVPDGPRRRVSGSEPPTRSIGLRAASESDVRAANCFVFVKTLGDPDHTPPSVHISRVAERHGLAVHELDERAVLLVAAHRPGIEGAVAVARAAVDLDGAVRDSAMTVFAQRPGEPLEKALDRGAAALEQASMQMLFTDDDVARAIPVDDLIAELVGGEVAIERTEGGAATIPVRRGER